jgi:tetratricopeptide (TPR) repeat protein
VPSPSSRLPARELQVQLEQAVAHHRGGRLEEARLTYLRILRADAGHAEALRLLGSLVLSTGQVDAALPLLQAAVQHAPRSPEALYTFANGLQQKGQSANAVSTYRRALVLRPKFSEAHCNLGNALAAQEDWAAALPHYQAATSQRPDEPSYWRNLSLAHTKLKQPPEALKAARRAALLSPKSAAFAYEWGMAAAAAGEHREAADAFGRCTQLDPAHADGWLELGVAWQQLEKWEAAREAYRHCVALRPNSVAALSNLGTTFKQQRRFAEAAAAYRDALQHDAHNLAVLNNLAIALAGAKQWNDALAATRQLLALDPDHIDGLNTLGVTLTARCQFDEAENALRRSILLAPAEAGSHCNLANLLLAQGRTTEALACYTAARTLAPHLDTLGYNQGLCQLRLGHLRQGFINYELRLAKRSVEERARFRVPRLMPGSSLAGRTLLVHAEQGLGDTLQFVRYISLLAAQGATVHVEVQAPLETLLKGLAGAASVFRRGQPLPAFDLHTPLLSLPHILGTTLETIPAEVPYVIPVSNKVAAWAQRLPSGGGPRVGLVWSGNPLHENDHNRSIPFTQLAPLLQLPGLQFISLQKEHAPADLAALARCPQVTLLAPGLVDFSDTAAVIAHLDAVISVDTSVAHLAGAMGKRLFVLLPFAPDWRWLEERTDNPWYPSATLCRQREPGDWSGPVAGICRYLNP